MNSRAWQAIGVALAAVAVAGAAAALRGIPGPPHSAAAEGRPAAIPPGMVFVPAGPCWLGTDDPDADADARPRRRGFVPAFSIDRTEVTNAEFRRFRPGHVYPAGEDNRPVTNVTYPEAESFARWAGKRLPTEDEWEKAARGTDGRRYPWGNDWDPRRVAARARPVPGGPAAAGHTASACAVLTARVRPVGSHPEGASPYGCLDMAGNAWEWVQGFYNGNPQQRLLRGGAVGYSERDCRTYARAIEGAGAT